ncbi:hypothetical protein AMECASPLE_002455 [Ameca splendens]|uniref:Uncharacterized protein n=1 Tax=Ameca splendens TaxID=208324 RepID=A0ABV0XYA9_9TELE
MYVSQEQGILCLNRHLMEGGETPCKNRVLISVKHMADARDSQVKCYTHCLDSPTATQSSISTSNSNKNVCNTVSQYRPKIVYWCNICTSKVFSPFASNRNYNI